MILVFGDQNGRSYRMAAILTAYRKLLMKENPPNGSNGSALTMSWQQMHRMGEGGM